MTEIGMEEARQLYKGLPENVRHLNWRIHDTKKILINENLWPLSGGAIQIVYKEILEPDEDKLTELMGWPKRETK